MQSELQQLLITDFRELTGREYRDDQELQDSPFDRFLLGTFWSILLVFPVYLFLTWFALLTGLSFLFNLLKHDPLRDYFHTLYDFLQDPNQAKNIIFSLSY